MRIEIINGEDTLYPVTNKYSVTGHNNYNVGQILDAFSSSIYQCEISNKKMYICDKEDLQKIDISDIVSNTYDYSYKMYIYLNGSLLYEGKDYNMLNNETILLKNPTRINDTFIFEVIIKTKHLKEYNKKHGCEINEKILINNILNRINTYCNN